MTVLPDLNGSSVSFLPESRRNELFLGSVFPGNLDQIIPLTSLHKMPACHLPSELPTSIKLKNGPFSNSRRYNKK